LFVGNGKWYILWTFGLFHGHLVYCVVIWYVLWSFGILIWYIFVPRKIWRPCILVLSWLRLHIKERNAIIIILTFSIALQFSFIFNRHVDITHYLTDWTIRWDLFLHMYLFNFLWSYIQNWVISPVNVMITIFGNFDQCDFIGRQWND
jgi:hypothetical protein